MSFLEADDETGRERLLLLLSSVVRIQCNKTEATVYKSPIKMVKIIFWEQELLVRGGEKLLLQCACILVQCPRVFALITQISTMQYFLAFAEILFCPASIAFHIPSTIMNLLFKIVTLQ